MTAAMGSCSFPRKGRLREMMSAGIIVTIMAFLSVGCAVTSRQNSNGGQLVIWYSYGMGSNGDGETAAFELVDGEVLVKRADGVADIVGPDVFAFKRLCHYIESQRYLWNDRHLYGLMGNEALTVSYRGTQVIIHKGVDLTYEGNVECLRLLQLLSHFSWQMTRGERNTGMARFVYDYLEEQGVVPVPVPLESSGSHAQPKSSANPNDD